MKRIISSSLLTIAALAVIVGGTGAFFSDTETSAGNVFTAGSIDLMINHTAATYNGEACDQNCEVSDGAQNLLVNGSFEEDEVADNNGDYEFFDSITGWDKVNGTYIELQRDAFTSADGEQHLELDGDGEDSSTVIEQTFNTTPGQRYQLSFEHSPRPDEQAGDSEVIVEVEVVSNSDTPLPNTIVTGNGAIDWETATYEFIAADSQTTLRFSQGGTANTYGGLVDDVKVLEMTCADGDYSDTPGGFCELWESKDLTSESFFDFVDIKPQDEGTNLISMTVEDNESYICLNVDEDESASTPGNGGGELSDFLEVVGWYADSDGTIIDNNPAFAPTTVSNLGSVTYADSSDDAIAPGETQYLLLEWCMGEISLNGTDVSCNGNVPNINDTQAAELIADLQFYAIQSRNNGDFTCDAAEFEVADQT